MLGGYALTNSVLLTEAGYIYVVQNNLSGSIDNHTEPGIHRRMPFFLTVTLYKQVLTITQDSTVCFADTYLGTVPASSRISVIKLHTEFCAE